MSYSRQLLRGLMGLLGFFSVLLAIAIVLQRDRLESRSFEGEDRFVPVAQVERVVRLSQLLSAPGERSEAPPGDLAQLASDCDARALAVVVGRLSIAGDPAASEEHWPNRLALAWSERRQAAAAPWRAATCGPFLRDLALVAQHPAWLTTQAFDRRDALVAQSLAERVSWTTLPPCLFGRDSVDAWVLLSGPRARCGLASPPTGAPRLLRELSGWITPRAMLTDAVQADVAPRQLRLSLSGRLQQHLEEFLPAAAQDMRGLSMVVMDPKTMGILAMGCEGSACDQRGVEGSRPLAPLLVEAPPASVAKLLFGMALANQVPKSVLQVHIKTSLPNEWWERAAICDLGRPTKTPPPCNMSSQVGRVVEQAGWSRNRVNLSGAGLSLPASAGRFAALEGQQGPATMLAWRDYEDVRSRRAAPPRGPAYGLTSQMVQSVLGAGDARVTAFGVASLAAQIANASRGRLSPMPWLLRDDTTPSRMGPSLEGRLSAETVRNGMAKVMMPAEPGWSGSGTGHAAVEAAFGRPCGIDCPLQGKTGTVGQADVGFAGTTIFAGIVETGRLAPWLGLAQLATGETLPEELVIGVLAFPKGAATPGSGHAASRHAMRWLANLTATGQEP